MHWALCCDQLVHFITDRYIIYIFIVICIMYDILIWVAKTHVKCMSQLTITAMQAVVSQHAGLAGVQCWRGLLTDGCQI